MLQNLLNEAESCSAQCHDMLEGPMNLKVYILNLCHLLLFSMMVKKGISLLTKEPCRMLVCCLRNGKILQLMYQNSRF